MRVQAIAAVTALLVVGAGCGDMGSASARPEQASVTLKVVTSRYGKAIADSTGEALYLFTRDGRGASRCYGACAGAWPPFIAKGKLRAGKGIRASWLATRRRSDGRRQVTYRGQPLYYYVQDKPGVILCQNVTEYGGDWLVVAPSGRAIR